VLREPGQGGFVTASQAFNRSVISAVRASMDRPFPRGFKKYTKNVAGFGEPLPPVPTDGEQVST
jgi:hypothetical protein